MKHWHYSVEEYLSLGPGGGLYCFDWPYATLRRVAGSLPHKKTTNALTATPYVTSSFFHSLQRRMSIQMSVHDYCYQGWSCKAPKVTVMRGLATITCLQYLSYLFIFVWGDKKKKKRRWEATRIKGQSRINTDSGFHSVAWAPKRLI